MNSRLRLRIFTFKQLLIPTTTHWDNHSTPCLSSTRHFKSKILLEKRLRFPRKSPKIKKLSKLRVQMLVWGSRWWSKQSLKRIQVRSLTWSLLRMKVTNFKRKTWIKSLWSAFQINLKLRWLPCIKPWILTPNLTSNRFQASTALPNPN